MKIGTMSQQKRPDKMKRPRFLNCEEVPRQIVSSAMTQVLSDRRRSTSADGVTASSFHSRKLSELGQANRCSRFAMRSEALCVAPRRPQGDRYGNSADPVAASLCEAKHCILCCAALPSHVIRGAS